MLIAKLALYLAVFNIVLTAAKQVLDKVAAGSKADTIVGKIADGVAKVISFVSANTQKPADAPVADAPKV